MSDDYRKPAVVKTATDVARGTPVRRVDPPEARKTAPTGADPRNKAKFAAEATAAAVALEAAKRSAAITARVSGGVMLGAGLLFLALERGAYAQNGYIALSRRGEIALGLMFSLGPWMLAFGSGGAARAREAPEWYRWGAAVTAVLGAGFFAMGGARPILEAILGATL